jgi:hypothetical protein
MQTIENHKLDVNHISCSSNVLMNLIALKIGLQNHTMKIKPQNTQNNQNVVHTKLGSNHKPNLIKIEYFTIKLDKFLFFKSGRNYILHN